MALMQSEETLQTQQKQMLVWRSYGRKRGDVCLCQGRAEVCLVANGGTCDTQSSQWVIAVMSTS